MVWVGALNPPARSFNPFVVPDSVVCVCQLFHCVNVVLCWGIPAALSNYGRVSWRLNCIVRVHQALCGPTLSHYGCWVCLPYYILPSNAPHGNWPECPETSHRPLCQKPTNLLSSDLPGRYPLAANTNLGLGADGRALGLFRSGLWF